MATQPIGTTKGPGQTPHSFTLVAPDPDDRLKTGEFVYYEAGVDGQARQILGRVDARRAVKLYPDSFMADPSVAPSQVAELVGFDQSAPELYELEVSVLGYFDPALGFVNPRIPPRTGRPVYLAPDELLATVLNRRQSGEPGGAHIGSLLTREAGRVPLVLDINEFASTHLAIIAGTGAGKSYLAGVLVEELLKPANRAAVLIVDPHGEYGTLTALADSDQFRDDDYAARVHVVRPDSLKIRRAYLDNSDIFQLVGSTTGLSQPQRVLLRRALTAVRGAKREKWLFADLLEAVRTVDFTGLGSVAGEDSEGGFELVRRALAWRLGDTLGRRDGVFDDYHHTPLTELLRPGQCTVLQLSEIPREEQQIIVATVLRRSYDGRLLTAKDQMDERDERYIPFPVFTLIEEAHHFAPAAEDVTTTNLLKQILAEGRKFGFGVGLITQRPGKLDQDVLSQCMTQCILRVVNPTDQQAIGAAIESAGHELLRELPAVSKGQAIVAGAGVNTTALVRVRQRITPHGGATPDVVQAWRAHRDAQARDRGPAFGQPDPESALTPEERLFGPGGSGPDR